MYEQMCFPSLHCEPFNQVKIEIEIATRRKVKSERTIKRKKTHTEHLIHNDLGSLAWKTQNSMCGLRVHCQETTVREKIETPTEKKGSKNPTRTMKRNKAEKVSE